jgi:hypothetical protein
MYLAKLFKHNNKKLYNPSTHFLFSLFQKETKHIIMEWLYPFMTSNIQQKSSLTWSSTSHLDPCTSMEHAHPSSYAQRVFQMSLTHWVKFEPKFIYDQILHQCEVSSSPWVGRANKVMTSCYLFYTTNCPKFIFLDFML